MATDLDILTADLDEPRPRGEGPPTGQFYFTRREPVHGPKHFRAWFESLADYMLANPTAKGPEIGKQFGKSSVWISSVINSDAFKTYFSVRRQHFNELHDSALRTKSTEVAMKSMDLILEVMEKKRDKISLVELVKVNDSALQALGYGSAASPAPSVVVNNQSLTVNASVLGEAREQIRTIQHERLKLLESPGAAPGEIPEGLRASPREGDE